MRTKHAEGSENAARDAGSRRSAWSRAWASTRAVLRLSAFVAENLALALLFFMALPLTAGSPSLREGLRAFVFKAWSRASLACAGVRVNVRGDPPRGPCFLVANHLVYLDIWLLASRTGAVFVAQSGISRWPFFGLMARVLSIIFIDRGNKRAIPEVNRRIEEALEAGRVMALFPEGKTGGGERVLPFRSSLLEPAARGGHPVAWATIEYRTGRRDPPASRAVCWKDGEPLAAHARKLLLLDRVDATVTFGEGMLRGGDRKELAAELQRRVEARFAPLP